MSPLSSLRYTFTSGAVALIVNACLGLTSVSQIRAQEPQPAVHPGSRQIAEAKDQYIAGARLLDRGDLAGAEVRFAKAAALNPENHDYLQAAALAHEHRVTELVQQAGKARMLGKPAESDQLLAQARNLDPDNAIV